MQRALLAVVDGRPRSRRIHFGESHGNKRWQIEQTLTATLKARRGDGTPAPPLWMSRWHDDIYVVMTRYASGAIRFHMPSEPARRGKRRGTRTVYRFSIPVPAAPVPEAGGRRGFISAAIKTVVLKVAGKIADYALAKLALLWETTTWKLKDRREGWLAVTPKDSPATTFFPRLICRP